MNSLKKVIYVFTTLFLLSCSQDLDFNQVDDYYTTPIFTSSVTYFAVSPNKFVDPTGTFQVTEIEDISDFRLFDNGYIKSNLVRLDFNVEVNNEIDRDFTIEFELLGDNNNLIYKLQDLKVEGSKLNILPVEIIDINLNKNVRNTTKVKILIKLDDTSIPLDINDNGVFELNSSATLYLETKL